MLKFPPVPLPPFPCGLLPSSSVAYHLSFPSPVLLYTQLPDFHLALPTQFPTRLQPKFPLALLPNFAPLLHLISLWSPTLFSQLPTSPLPELLLVLLSEISPAHCPILSSLCLTSLYSNSYLLSTPYPISLLIPPPSLPLDPLLPSDFPLACAQFLLASSVQLDSLI